jgi:hypothetical protein
MNEVQFCKDFFGGGDSLKICKLKETQFHFQDFEVYKNATFQRQKVLLKLLKLIKMSLWHT